MVLEQRTSTRSESEHDGRAIPEDQRSARDALVVYAFTAELKTVTEIADEWKLSASTVLRILVRARVDTRIVALRRARARDVRMRAMVREGMPPNVVASALSVSTERVMKAVRDRDVADAYLRGDKLHDIARACGLQVDAVSKILKRDDVPLRGMLGPRPRNQQRDETIRALAAAGTTLTQIAERYGISRNRVSQIVGRTKNRHPAFEDDAPEYVERNSLIVRLHLDGWSLRQIAPRFGLTSGRISHIITRAKLAGTGRT